MRKLEVLSDWRGGGWQGSVQTIRRNVNMLDEPKLVSCNFDVAK